MEQETTHPAKVALFVPSMRGGGAERAMLALASGLSSRGIPVDLVLANAEGEYIIQVPDEVCLIDLDSQGTAASLPRLVSYLRRERPAVLLSTLAHANVVALAAKLLLWGRLRVVTRVEVTLSEMFKDCGFKDRQALRLLKFLLPLADRVVAVSRGVADDLRCEVPSASRKIMTVYNPVVQPDHSAKAANPVQHPWFNAEDAPVILTAGRLTPQKDHATLLRAFAEVVRSRLARLVILGVGPERDSLLSLAKSLGVSEQVDLPGFKDNPFAYMSRSNVFVLSSRYEGLPNALVQAMACGTPVVSTDCPSGPSEILEGGKWGRLVPVGDWRAMAEAIIDTLDNPLPPEQLISRASAFSAEASVDRYLEVLTGPG